MSIQNSRFVNIIQPVFSQFDLSKRTGQTALLQVADDRGNGVLLVADGDHVCRSLDGIGRVGHGNAKTGNAQHADVVVVISHGDGAARVDAKNFG